MLVSSDLIKLHHARDFAICLDTQGNQLAIFYCKQILNYALYVNYRFVHFFTFFVRAIIVTLYQFIRIQ